jgi:large subunit ribosomal protein L23
MNVYEVIIRPVVTETSTLLAAEQNQYTFEVHMDANKIQVRDAVMELFKVDVVRVTTAIMPLKQGRRGRKLYVRQAAWKKAIVTLPPGQTIAAFNL